MRAVVAVIALSAATSAAAGPARERLDAFLRDLDALQAQFSQVLLDEAGKPADESSGTVYLQRPGRFRWDYTAPHPQLIVADGERVWLFDPGLAQVTVRPQGAALGATPAALLTSDKPVDQSFTVTELGERDDGSAWVALAPLASEGGFDGIRVGFGSEGLRTMELRDSFGQTTRIVFSQIRRNPELDGDLFRFTPPAGVDVVQGQ